MTRPEKIPPPLCVFCNAPWTDDMVQIEAYASAGCDTCGYGSTTSGTVSVVCSSCHKTVYIKEFSQ